MILLRGRILVVIVGRHGEVDGEVCKTGRLFEEWKKTGSLGVCAVVQSVKEKSGKGLPLSLDNFGQMQKIERTNGSVVEGIGEERRLMLMGLRRRSWVAVVPRTRTKPAGTDTGKLAKLAKKDKFPCG